MIMLSVSVALCLCVADVCDAGEVLTVWQYCHITLSAELLTNADISKHVFSLLKGMSNDR